MVFIHIFHRHIRAHNDTSRLHRLRANETNKRDCCKTKTILRFIYIFSCVSLGEQARARACWMSGYLFSTRKHVQCIHRERELFALISRFLLAVCAAYFCRCCCSSRWHILNSLLTFYNSAYIAPSFRLNTVDRCTQIIPTFCTWNVCQHNGTLKMKQ